MKAIKFILMVSTLGVLFGCGGDEDTPTPDGLSVSNFSITIDENPQQGAVIGTIQASSGEGSLVFSIESQTPDNALTISNSGSLTVADETLFDFETITQITAVINVTDGVNNATSNVTITLNDVNEVTNFTVTGFVLDATENITQSSVLGIIQVSVSGNYTFTIASESVSGAFEVNSDGQVMVNQPSVFDFETNPQIIATVAVSDGISTENASIEINLSDDVLELDNGLLAYYPLDDNFNDYSGNGFNASETGVSEATDRHGNENKAINVSEGNIIVNNFFTQGVSTSFSFSAWVRNDGENETKYRTILYKGNSEGFREVQFRIRVTGAQTWEDGSMEVFLNNNGNNGTRNAGNLFPSNEWVHVAMTYDATTPAEGGLGTVKLYQDGVEVASKEVDFVMGESLISMGGATRPSDGKGDATYFEPFSGDMDDVAFFDQVLSASEIETLSEM